jgi:hypothetical protein
MRASVLPASGLLAAALLLPACLEADVHTEIRADGSGAMGVSMKFSEKMVEILQKLEKINPKEDIVKQAREGMPKKPDEKTLAELEKKGVKLSEFETVANEKQISAKVKVEFKTVEALRHFKDAQGSREDGPMSSLYTLTVDDKGVYTLAMATEEDGDGDKDEAGEGKEPGKEEAGEEEDPEAAAKKAGEAMAVMGELMGEASKFRMTMVMKVPGEVVDYEPKIAAKKEGGTVTWNFTFQSIMELSMAGGNGIDEMGGEPSNPLGNFKVRFKMPEGQALPAASLWAGPPKKPATPTAPPAPAPAKDEGKAPDPPK